MVGSTGDWFKMNDRSAQTGSFFDQAQVSSATRVVVLGPTAVSNLFGCNSAVALGSTVRINHQSFTVIGVMQPAACQVTTRWSYR